MDGDAEILAANILAKNILSQVDNDGYRHQIMVTGTRSRSWMVFKTRFTFKNDKVERPSSYLGARLELKSRDTHPIWTVNSVNYAAITKVEKGNYDANAI